MITGPAFSYVEHPAIKAVIEQWVRYVVEDPLAAEVLGKKPQLSFSVPNASKKDVM